MINEDKLQKVHVLDQGNGRDQLVQFVGADTAYNDEINLLDLWLVLVKHRNILLIIILAFVVSGVTFSLIKPVLYDYNAVLQVGAVVTPETGNEKYIESPANVLEKLTRSYIPLVRSEFLKDYPELQFAPIVNASMSKGSDLIVIQTRAEEKDGSMSLELIHRIIAYIQKNHQPQMDINRNEIELSLQKEKIILSRLENPLSLKVEQESLEVDLLEAGINIKNLKDERLIRVLKQQLMTQKKKYSNEQASLVDESRRLTSELERLKEVDRLLEKQIVELSSTIGNELKDRKASVSSVSSGAEAMTVLLLDSQIQANRNRLAALEERLSVKQQSLREKLDNQIKANARSQTHHQTLISDLSSQLRKIDIDTTNDLQKTTIKQSGLQISLNKMQSDHKSKILLQQQKIDGIAIKLKGLRDTQTLTEPMKSLDPVGTGKKIIVVIALMAGLFVGIFSIFVMEFLSKVKERSQELNDVVSH